MESLLILHVVLYLCLDIIHVEYAPNARGVSLVRA